MVLKLRRRKSSPNWYIRGTVRGIYVDETTGTPERSIAEVIRAKREWESYQESIFGRKSTTTFEQAAQSYIQSGGEARFTSRLVTHFGATSLARIDQSAIDKAARTIMPQATGATINRQIYTPMSAILQHAAKRGMCEPFRLERPRQAKGRIRWLTPEEAEKLIEACAPHLRPLVVFLFYTGARLSEALFVEWRQLDLGRGEVQFLDTKNGDARGVPLHPRVIDELRVLRHREGQVFRRADGCPYARKPFGGGQIRSSFEAACKHAGITNFRPHDCRHTWATWHYACNRDLVALMSLGGWRSERMALRYAHVNVSHLAPSILALPWQNGALTRARDELAEEDAGAAGQD